MGLGLMKSEEGFHKFRVPGPHGILFIHARIKDLFCHRGPTLMIFGFYSP